MVWFGERLDGAVLDDIGRWIGPRRDEKPDLVLVIGTSAVVWPAAGYVETARGPHTSVVTINLEAELPENLAKMNKSDFAFAGDAAELLPRLLEPVIGKMKDDGTFE